MRRSKKILITGASGFIGRHVLELLEKEKGEIHAISHNLSFLKEPYFEQKKTKVVWHKLNLLNLREQKKLLAKIKPTHLLHLAWETTPGKYWDSQNNVYWVEASLELALNFAKHGGQRAVFAGTCVEYNPNSLYGVCKQSLQKIITQLSPKIGLNSVWGRIFSPYGPYESFHRLIPSVINSLLEKKPVFCSAGTQVRDFLLVRDVALAFDTLLKSKIEGSVDIASGKPKMIKSIIRLIARELKRPDLIKLGQIPLKPGEPLKLVSKDSRLKKELGWQPQYNLEEGLLLTIKWWQDQKNEIKD